MASGRSSGEASRRALFALLAIALAGVTVYAQLRELNQISTLQIPAGGLRPARHFLETEQVERHRAVLERRAGDAWQYRVLAPALNEALFRVGRRLGPVALPDVFVGLRLAQNALIFLAFSVFLLELGLTGPATALGLSLLAYAMSLSTWHAGLAFATWYELLFFLCGAILVLRERTAWMLPLAVLAALNKESSLLLPVLLLAPAAGDAPAPRSRRTLLAACIGAQLLVLVGLRTALGPQPLIVPEGHPPGAALLGYNLGRPVTWIHLLLTFGVVPGIALADPGRWPPVLRRWALWLALPWLGTHLFLAILAESRLLLVPYALVFLPAALLAVTRPR